MEHPSPFFRYDNVDVISSRRQSPLFTSLQESRSQTRSESSITRPNRHAKQSLLPTLFRSPIESAPRSTNPFDSVDQSELKENRSDRNLRNSILSQGNQARNFELSTLRSSSWLLPQNPSFLLSRSARTRANRSYRSDEYWRMQFEARQSAGKHAILTEIEIFPPFSIWLLLSLPLILTILVVSIHGYIKWETSILTLQSFDFAVENGLNRSTSNTQWIKCFRSTFLEKYQSFARIYFHVQLLDELSMNSTLFHEQLNSFVTVTTTARFLIPTEGQSSYEIMPVTAYDINYYPIYILDRFARSASHNSTYILSEDHKYLKIPMPFLSLESMVPRTEIYSPWVLEVNFTSDSIILADQLAISVESNVFSRSYMYLSCAESLLLTFTSLILLVMFCQRLRKHANYAWQSVSKELPYPFRRLISPWHLILPEQYACVMALCLLMMWNNPIRSVFLLWESWQQMWLLPSKVSIVYGFWLSFLSSCIGYAFVSTVIGYVHGLRYNSNDYEEKSLLQSLNDAVENFVIGYVSDMQVTIARSIVKNIHRIYILPHHIFSVQFLDFFLSRLVWWCVSCGVSFVYHSVLFTSGTSDAHTTLTTKFFKIISSVFYTLSSSSTEDGDNAIDNDSNWVSDWLWWASLLYQLISLTWLVWFGVAWWRTGTLLKSSRLSTSRMRHILYRVLSLQLYACIVVFGGIMIHMFTISSSIDSSRTIWTEGVDLFHVRSSLIAMYIFVSGWISFFGVSYTYLLGASALTVSPVAEMQCFIAITTVVIAYTLLPPIQVDLAQDRHIIVPLRRQLPYISAKRSKQNKKQQSNNGRKNKKKNTNRNISDNENQTGEESQSLLPKFADSNIVESAMHAFQTQSQDPLEQENFCLERACHLLEVSYQTYFTSNFDDVTHSINNVSEVHAGNSANIHTGEYQGSDTIDIPPTNQADNNSNKSNVFFEPKMDLHRLGLEKWSHYSCREHSTFGLIACHPEVLSRLTSINIDTNNANNNSNNFVNNSNTNNSGGINANFACENAMHEETTSFFAQHEHVVAFRGSTLANIAADFKFALMPLPELKRSPSFLLKSFLKDTKNTRIYDSIPHNNHQANDDLEANKTLNEEMKQEKDDNNNNNVKMQTKLPIDITFTAKVHVGFWQSYASLRDNFFEQEIALLFSLYSLHRQKQEDEQKRKHSSSAYGSVSEHINNSDIVDNNNNWAKVCFTGHSLGAAMALLAAVDLAVNMPVILQAFEDHWHQSNSNSSSNNKNDENDSNDIFSPPEIVVYLFGCPRVGNVSFAQLVSRLLSTCYRVQVDGDIVTMVPKFLGWYRHSGTEVLLDPCVPGNMVVSPTLLENLLWLKSNTGSVMRHSLDVYRTCLEAGFEKEEYEEYIAQEQSLSSASTVGSGVDASSRRSSTGDRNRFNLFLSQSRSLSVDV